MELIQVIGKPPKDTQSQILLIGKFDGVHIGHTKIIQTARSYIENDEILSVMSFTDHPLWVLRQDKKYQHAITPENDKIQILKDFGVERLYQIHFTKEYANTTAEEFVLEHLSLLNIKRIVVGEGFRFGKGSQSNTNDLIELCRQLSIPVTVVPHMKINGKKISSTSIRNFITTGKIEAAQSLLGRPYNVSGKVIHGEALGRTLGFPTLNITGADDNYVLPKPGIYAGVAKISDDEYWNTIISVGFRPTVNGENYLIEAHLLDYSGDLYDQMVSISFLKYMREEIKFSNLDLLIEQMNKDKHNANVFFGMSHG